MSFESWRQTIPFSDAAIAGALRGAADETPNPFLRDRYRRWAGMVDDGHLAGFMLGTVLPRLIVTCALCGKKALYRYGAEGRCRAHKDARPDYALARSRRREARGAMFEAETTERDNTALARESLRRTWATRKGRR
jgi:hypothetical protein